MASHVDETVGVGAPAALGDAFGELELARLRERCRRLERNVRHSERERRHAIERLLRAEEQERRRLAAELHDDTVQVLTACLVVLDRLGYAADATDPERISTAVGAARRTLAAATDRTRRLMFELRPTSLHDEGLAGALADLADQAAEEAGVVASVSVAPDRYPYVVEELAYRTVREAIANVRKHARASAIGIEVEARDGVLRGRVTDDGRGFDVDAAAERSRRQRRMGLDTMRERLHLAGGSVDVRSAPGSGTVIAFELPTQLS
ncbi:MAG TPA: ATP-binding protein [Gaiellales bacterium]|nr:ATP-binding protein [Gaiellales bacterium]